MYEDVKKKVYNMQQKLAAALGRRHDVSYVLGTAQPLDPQRQTAWEPDESDYCHHLIVLQMRLLMG